MAIQWHGLATPVSPGSFRYQRTWKETDHCCILRYDDPLGRFQEYRIAQDGSSITVSHHTPWDWPEFLLPLLAPALTSALYLRQTPVLHGSAVSVGGGAMVLLGASEAGKSTLAAALVEEGQPLLSEEIVVLCLKEEGVFIHPGHSLLKLSPDSVLAMRKSPDELPLVFPGSKLTNERWLDAGTLKGGFRKAPEPLRIVYILAGRRPGIEEPQITPLPPAEACLALNHFFYGSWLPRMPVDSVRVCARVAGAVAVRRVWLPDGIDHLTVAARTLLDDTRSLTAKD